MDSVAWVLLLVIFAVTGMLAAGGPRIYRAVRRLRASRGSGVAGISAGMDAIWHPTSEDAAREVAAEIAAPAPTPSPGDPGRMQDGRIRIVLRDQDAGWPPD